MLSLSATRYLNRRTCMMLSRKLCLDPFCSQISPQHFFVCHQMKTHEKIFWWVFSACLQAWEFYVSTKMYTLQWIIFR